MKQNGTSGKRGRGVRAQDVREVGKTVIHAGERLGEEYLHFLDKAHYVLSDAGRDAGYDKSMAAYDTAHELVMPVGRTMLAVSASVAHIWLSALANAAEKHSGE
ncbi:MAG TPA: hypothetical protein V6D22_24505 [Candidatus Obscuribacterales bacterium]